MSDNNEMVVVNPASTGMSLFDKMRQEAAEVVPDIGGDLELGTSMVYANLLQANSPDVQSQEGRAGDWKLGSGDNAIITSAFAGFVVDMIGAPGHAAAQNPAQRKMWYGQTLTQQRQMFGDGPHCVSVDGVRPSPKSIQLFRDKNAGYAVDVRLPADVEYARAERGYNTPNDLVNFSRMVPITADTLCADCQLGKWYRPADGSKPAGPACSVEFKALIWVTQVLGVEDWEPQMVVLVGKGQAGRLFYSSYKGDRDFQQKSGVPALFDEAFPTGGMFARYGISIGNFTVVLPVLFGSKHVRSDSGNAYFLPNWINPLNDALRNSARSGADLNNRMQSVRDSLAASRFPEGASARQYPKYVQEIEPLVTGSVLTDNPDYPEDMRIAMEADLTRLVETFQDYWAVEAGGKPKGRVEFTTYREAGNDDEGESVDAVNHAAPAVPAAAPTIPTMPSSVPSEAAKLPKIEVPEEERGWKIDSDAPTMTAPVVEEVVEEESDDSDNLDSLWN